MITCRDVLRRNIVIFRKWKGWTQFDLAEKLGKNKNTISLYERGEIVPTPEVLDEMAILFGRSLSEFFK